MFALFGGYSSPMQVQDIVVQIPSSDSKWWVPVLVAVITVVGGGLMTLYIQRKKKNSG